MKLFTFTKLFLINIFDFKGRASRWEYWGGGLGASLIGFVIVPFVALLLGGEVFLLLVLYFVFAQFSCGIRRLHDVGKSGWTLLWGLVPLFGGMYLLYLYVQPSELKNNQWGGVPPHIRYDSFPEVTQDEIVDEEGEETSF